MTAQQQIFIFAGEPSGDLHGSHLMRELKQLLPAIEISGVGGPAMRQEGISCFLPMEEFEVMGFTDVLKSLPKLWRHFYRLRDHLLTAKPALIVFIDYPGFNLRMAQALRKKGFKGKIIHYIAPSVWAHGKGRIQQMAKTLDGLLTIFPFEANFFSDTPLKVDYVGNPLQEYTTHYRYDQDWAKKNGIANEKNLVALFPGSRRGEIMRNLPTMLQAAEMLKKEHPEISFAISYTNETIKKTIKLLMEGTSLKNVHLIPKAYAYEMMKTSHMAIAKSGTVTLELALHECPTLVVYHVTPLNRFIAKVFLRLQLTHYCIVNILKGETVFPELIETGFSKENIYHHAKLLYTSGPLREACKAGCLQIKKLLKEERASAKAAQKIAEHLTC
jgi:lipid-A-disaccharide synthase